MHSFALHKNFVHLIFDKMDQGAKAQLLKTDFEQFYSGENIDRTIKLIKPQIDPNTINWYINKSVSSWYRYPKHLSENEHGIQVFGIQHHIFAQL